MSPDAAAVLAVRDLRRSYGRRRRRVEALRDVTFTVARGEIFGLIGPDGAGKTSIIQTLAGVLRPDAGAAVVDGFDVATDAEAIKRRIGYMPQGLGSNLYDSLTVSENIEFFRDLRQLPADTYRANLAALLSATRLEPFLRRRAAHLSGGMRQKLALVCTLIHLPDVLLLDEPTTGVDPVSRQEFWQIVRRIVDERGSTVLLSTSYMDEAERCHRVALLHGGVLLAEGTPAAVRSRATGHFARMRAVPQTGAMDVLRARPDVSALQVLGDRIHFQFDGALRDIETALAGAGVAVADAAIREPGLEDVLLQMIGEPPAPAERVTFDGSATTADATAIDCRGVVRRFGAFTAVEHVDLAVRRGEIFGLLGPNGAGKTTLIKMMCGLLEPSAGTILTGGADVVRDRSRVRMAIGYMSQRFSLYQDLSVRQNLRLYADLYGVARESYAQLTARLGLEPFMARLPRDLPGGVRQRLSLLCAILHRPPIVFLDEPTSGVDPRARRVFWDLIYGLSRDAGVTVLVSTHYMDEAVHCDRLALMDEARLVAVGSPADLVRDSEARSGRLLAVSATDASRACAVLRATYPSASLFGHTVHVRSLDPDADRAAVRALLERSGVPGARVEPAPLSMDETFIDCIQRAETTRA